MEEFSNVCPYCKQQDWHWQSVYPVGIGVCSCCKKHFGIRIEDGHLFTSILSPNRLPEADLVVNS